MADCRCLKSSTCRPLLRRPAVRSPRSRHEPAAAGYHNITRPRSAAQSQTSPRLRALHPQLGSWRRSACAGCPPRANRQRQSSASDARLHLDNGELDSALGFDDLLIARRVEKGERWVEKLDFAGEGGEELKVCAAFEEGVGGELEEKPRLRAVRVVESYLRV